jgi:hypothetical protein
MISDQDTYLVGKYTAELCEVVEKGDASSPGFALQRTIAFGGVTYRVVVAVEERDQQS